MTSTSGSIADGDGLRPEARRSYAVVLYFDDVAECRVREIWATLDRSGVASAGATCGADYRPHLTLAIVDTRAPTRVAESLRRALGAVEGTPVTLGALGFFLTGRAPAYLAVAPTARLVILHEAVHAALQDGDSWLVSWNYYRPGSWMPHCTLAMDVTSPAAVAEVVGATPLPIHATVSAAGLCQLPDASGPVSSGSLADGSPVGSGPPAGAAERTIPTAAAPAVPEQQRVGARHLGTSQLLSSLSED